MTTKGDQWPPVCKAHRDEDIKEPHDGGKCAYKYEFEEYMYVSTLLNA